MGTFRAGITDRGELREGGEQRPAAWEEGRAWKPGIRQHGGAALETGLGDLRRVGAELDVSSSPHANRNQGLGLPRSPHSCENQNCSFLGGGRGCGGSRGPRGPAECQTRGWGSGETQPSHSDKTEPSPPCSHVWAAHGTRQEPAATCGPSESYGSLKAGPPSYTLSLHLKDE